MMIFGLIIIIGVMLWIITLIWKVVSTFIEVKGSITIVKHIDLAYEKWLRKNQIYREITKNESEIHSDVPVDEDIPIENEIQDAVIVQWRYVTQTCGLVAVYMILCNMLINWGSLLELIIGSIVGIGISTLQIDVSRRDYLQKFAAIAMGLPLLMIIIRNFIDTYRMGLWIFSLSAIQLYLTQWLGVLFYYLVRRSLQHHHHPKNIAVMWGLIIFTIAIL